MTWCSDVQTCDQTNSSSSSSQSHNAAAAAAPPPPVVSISQSDRTRACPSCGHLVKCQGRINDDLRGLPAGVRFDPTDQELLQHLERKVKPADQTHNHRMIHPLLDEFIPTLTGENGICYTHPEKLPGASKDGQVRHFFHRPSKAYTTGTRKRRKVDTEGDDGSETRWHKTGKTRPVLVDGRVRGFKKILVLYTNYGKLKKPEKTNWVMHQYHLGHNEEEEDGELVVSKVFYQTQPRHCSSSSIPKAKDSSKINLRASSVGGVLDHRDTNQSVIGGDHAINRSSSTVVIALDQQQISHRPSASRLSTVMFPFCCP
ncbi:hypothetical protein Dimus_009539 [Dionaea muscipula]